MHRFESAIDSAWEKRASLSDSEIDSTVRPAVEAALASLESGELRVAEPRDGAWHVNQWLKKAVLLSFRITPNRLMPAEPAPYFDKVPMRFAGFDEARFKALGARAVPGAIVRRGACIAKDVVLMPSFVNIGANVGSGTMVDTWATVGSCAQIGADVHLAGGVGVGGVLEPVQARPVIVEDGAFIGSRCILTEGVLIGERAVLAPNVSLTGSVPVIDVTGPEPIEHRGYVPPRAVVVPGTRPKEFPAGTYEVACALVVGWRSAQTDLKTSLNDTLREFEIGA